MALSNRQYDALMRRYEERQRRNDEEIREKKRRLLLKVPGLRELEQEIARCTVSGAKAAIFSDADPGELLKASREELQTLHRKKEALLREKGIPEDYLTPSYTCPDCRDTGFIDGEPCHCFVREAAALSFENAKLPINFRGQSFEDFSLDYYEKTDSGLDEGGSTPYDSARSGLARARAFVDSFGSGRENLLLYGPPGVGKTFLSSCIAKALLDQNVFVLYLSAFSLFETLKEGTFARSGQVPDSYRLLFTCDLLIIDDLGTEFSNSMTNAQLFTLLNERILDGRSTIVSTNLELAGISETYTERLFSRFLEHYSFIHLFGRDIRLLKKMRKS